MTDEAAMEPSQTEAVATPVKAVAPVEAEVVTGEVNEGEAKGASTEMEQEQEQEGKEDGKGKQEEKKKTDPVQLGPILFTNPVDLFMYFYQLLRGWPEGLDMNEYEHLVLLDLLNKGHTDPASKIGPGVQAFQAKTHPKWQSLCYYVVRTDGTSEDFSYRKCMSNLMTIPPELMDLKPQGGKFRGDGGGRGGGRGRGRGGRGGRGRGRGRGRT